MKFNNIIALTRGDNLTLSVSLKKDGIIIPLTEGDTVYFTVKTSTDTDKKAFQKKITTFNQDGIAVIAIVPQDTTNLIPGSYVYDIQYTDKYGSVMTIIKPSCFQVMKEVTYE